jgi:hypothetical protein
VAVKVMTNRGTWVKYPNSDAWAVTEDGMLKVKRSERHYAAFFAPGEWARVEEDGATR